MGGWTTQEFDPAKLISLRERRGWSRRRLAEAAGVSRGAIWGAESGRTVPRDSTRDALAQALGTTVEELFGSLAEQNTEQDTELNAGRGTLPGEYPVVPGQGRHRPRSAGGR